MASSFLDLTLALILRQGLYLGRNVGIDARCVDDIGIEFQRALQMHVVLFPIAEINKESQSQALLRMFIRVVPVYRFLKVNCGFFVEFL